MQNEMIPAEIFDLMFLLVNETLLRIHSALINRRSADILLLTSMLSPAVCARVCGDGVCVGGDATS